MSINDGQMRGAIAALSPPWLSDDSPQGTPGNPNGGVSGRFMYCLGLASDMLLEKLNQGIKARMPTECDASALPLIGDDRVMTQGPGETDAAFRIRLQRAFETWQHAGEARAVLELVASFTAGQLVAPGVHGVPTVLLVGGYQARKWNWFTSESDPTAPPNHYQTTFQKWSWDGLESAQWWRSWLVLFATLAPAIATGTDASVVAGGTGNFVKLTAAAFPDGQTSLAQPAYVTLSGAASSGNNGTFQVVYDEVTGTHGVQIANPAAVIGDANNGSIRWSWAYYPGIQPTPVWGFPGATWSSLNSWGVMLAGGVSAAPYFAQLRAQVRLWKGAGTFIPAIIVSFGGAGQSSGAEFSPWSAEGAGNPDGTWATWAKIVAGRYVAARSTSVQLGAYDAFADGTQLYQQCYQPGT